MTREAVRSTPPSMALRAMTPEQLEFHDLVAGMSPRMRAALLELMRAAAEERARLASRRRK